MEVVLAAVALGLTIGLVFSCHKGRSDLLLEQEAHERTRTELADVKKANAELQRNLATTRALHPILELYGAGFSVYQSFDIRAEQGATSRFGRCGNQGCYNIQLRELLLNEITPSVWFGVWGAGFGMYDTGGISFDMALIRGCWATFRTNRHDFKFMIEDASITSLRVGFTIKAADGSIKEGATRFDTSCPETARCTP
jgi:hypothetical protein